MWIPDGLFSRWNSDRKNNGGPDHCRFVFRGRFQSFKAAGLCECFIVSYVERYSRARPTAAYRTACRNCPPVLFSSFPNLPIIRKFIRAVDLPAHIAEPAYLLRAEL